MAQQSFQPPVWGRAHSSVSSVPTSPQRSHSPPPPVSPASSARAKLTRSNSFPSPLSISQQLKLAAEESAPPMPPEPHAMAGYLKKLKSEEGSSKLGQIFQRSKFNKRWFQIDEAESEEADAAHAGILYELKYWKTESDVHTKLPGFVLPLHMIRGCDIGVGLGPYTREANTFHVETLNRTYVLTASSEQEMQWWITGIRYYVWMHKQTLLRLEKVDQGLPVGGAPSSSSKPSNVIVSQSPDPFAIKNAGKDSPDSSHASSAKGIGSSPEPSPLPVFSPLERAKLEKLQEARDDDDDDDENVDVALEAFKPPPGLPRTLSDEMERKYDNTHEFAVKTQNEMKTDIAAAPGGTTTTKKPPPGELSSPIRFNNPDVQTARPAGIANVTPSVLDSTRSEKAAAAQGSTAASKNPSPRDIFADHPTDRSQQQKSVVDHGALDHLDSHRYPALDSMRSHSNSAIGDAVFQDASAPPQTQRPAAPAVAVNKSATLTGPLVTNRPMPATNPHLTPSQSIEDPFSHRRAEKGSNMSVPASDTTGEEPSFRVMTSTREEDDAQANPMNLSSDDPFHAETANNHDDIEEENIQDALAEDEEDEGTSRKGKEDSHDLARSLDAGDESIMNGSVMLADSVDQDSKAFTVHPAVPSLLATANITLSKPVMKATTIPPLKTTTTATAAAVPTPPAPAVAAVPAAAVIAPHGLAVVPNRFNPSNVTKCDTAADLRQLRAELRAYGLRKFLRDHETAGWFTREGAAAAADPSTSAAATAAPNSSSVLIATGVKPFNPFARLVSGALPAPYGELLKSAGLTGFAERYFVACNRPELDEKWASADPEWVGKASMAKRHQFLLIKSLKWDTFNVATFGMTVEADLEGDKKAEESAATGSAASSSTSSALSIPCAPTQLKALREALSTLQDMERAALAYTRASNWSDQIGLYFHCFPWNSVQALHLHMVDLTCTGPTYDHLNHKNMPIRECMTVIEEEIKHVEARLSAAAASHHPLATVPTRFNPTNITKCDTAADLKRLRAELRIYGIRKFLRDHEAAGWFTREGAGSNATVSSMLIATGVKPFNPFARLVSGALAAPYGDLLTRAGLTDYATRYFVACNRPELDEKWWSGEEEWVGKASMAKRHQFLLIKSLKWDTFNVATFGMQAEAEAEDESKAIPASPSQLKSLKDALATLEEMEQVALAYTRASNWSSEIGLYFHCFPWNSVQALHLHMVDLTTTGPTYEHLKHKNMPIQLCMQVIRDEIQQVEKQLATASKVVAEPVKTAETPKPILAAAAPPKQPPPTPPAGAEQVKLTLDMPFSSIEKNTSFVGSFVNEMSSALAVSPSRLQVLSVEAGSVIVTMNMLPGMDAKAIPPKELVQNLKQQSADPNSALKKGAILSSLKGVEVLTPLAPAAKPTPPATPAAAAAAPAAPAAATSQRDDTNWKQALSNLIDTKLPYEDVATARGLNSTGTLSTSATPNVSARPVPIAKPTPPVAATQPSIVKSTPIAQCDQCYMMVTSANVSTAQYCWTCHTILCGACTKQHTFGPKLRAVDHVTEALDSFLTQQSYAYCTAHAVPAPALSASITLNAKDASVPATVITHGVRARALRFQGVFDSFCVTCNKLLCATCKQEDGFHYSGANNGHSIKTLPELYGANVAGLTNILSKSLLPKRNRLTESITTHSRKMESLATEQQLIQNETLSHVQKNCFALESRRDELMQEAYGQCESHKETIRKIELAQGFLQFSSDPTAASSSSSSVTSSSKPTPSPASMCSFLSLSPVLRAEVLALDLDPSHPIASNVAVAQVQQKFTTLESTILAERKEKQEKVQALPSLTHAISVKDKDLNALLASRRGLLLESAAQAESLNQLYMSAHEEIQRWVALTEDMSRQLSSMKQSCQYCGVPLSAAAANTRCSANRDLNSSAAIRGLHSFVPSLQPQHP